MIGIFPLKIEWTGEHGYRASSDKWPFSMKSQLPLPPNMSPSLIENSVAYFFDDAVHFFPKDARTGAQFLFQEDLAQRVGEEKRVWRVVAQMGKPLRRDPLVRDSSTDLGLWTFLGGIERIVPQLI